MYTGIFEDVETVKEVLASHGHKSVDNNLVFELLEDLKSKDEVVKELLKTRVRPSFNWSSGSNATLPKKVRASEIDDFGSSSDDFLSGDEGKIFQRYIMKCPERRIRAEPWMTAKNNANSVVPRKEELEKSVREISFAKESERRDGEKTVQISADSTDKSKDVDGSKSGAAGEQAKEEVCLFDDLKELFEEKSEDIDATNLATESRDVKIRECFRPKSRCKKEKLNELWDVNIRKIVRSQFLPITLMSDAEKSEDTDSTNSATELRDVKTGKFSRLKPLCRRKKTPITLMSDEEKSEDTDSTNSATESRDVKTGKFFRPKTLYRKTMSMALSWFPRTQDEMNFDLFDNEDSNLEPIKNRIEEMLEENNNDPNNILEGIQVLEQNNVSSTMQKNSSSLDKDKTVEEDCVSPKPGCSKDSYYADSGIRFIAGPDKKNVAASNSKYKSSLLAVCDEASSSESQSTVRHASWKLTDERVTSDFIMIKKVLPNADSENIRSCLIKNRDAINRVELTLWDLLPDERPLPILSVKRKQEDGNPSSMPKKMYISSEESNSKTTSLQSKSSIIKPAKLNIPEANKNIHIHPAKSAFANYRSSTFQFTKSLKSANSTLKLKPSSLQFVGSKNGGESVTSDRKKLQKLLKNQRFNYTPGVASIQEKSSVSPNSDEFDPILKQLASPNINPDTQYENLQEIFPDADPQYLRKMAEYYCDDAEAMKSFVQSKLDNPDYPTMADYLKRIKVTEQIKQYTVDFNPEKFLEIFPDPFKHFEDPKRVYRYNVIAFEFLKCHFRMNKVATILKVYRHVDPSCHLSLAAKELERLGRDMRSRRAGKLLPTEDIPLLQEIAFLQNKTEIREYMIEQTRKQKKEFETLKANNALVECQCCFDGECMPSQCLTCSEGHIFCKSCIKLGSATKIGEGQTQFPCFVDCKGEFTLPVLQKVLEPTTFSILLRKRQEEEVKAAGLEGLVSCPFCHFASIPPPEDKVFKCLNPECMKESCRLCKELNHVPLRCDEVTKGEEARRYLEEKMTEALVRKCYQCSRQFFKDEGCNKMTCPCGATTCYICGERVKDYSHFNGQGNTRTDLCPLYSDNKVLNAQSVRFAAEAAEKEILKNNPHLKIDAEALMPALPQSTKGPHQDIVNAHVLPVHIRRA